MEKIFDYNTPRYHVEVSRVYWSHEDELYHYTISIINSDDSVFGYTSFENGTSKEKVAKYFNDNINELANKPLIENQCTIFKDLYLTVLDSDSDMAFIEEDDFDELTKDSIERMKKDIEKMRLDTYIEYDLANRVIMAYGSLIEVFNMKGSD